MDGVELKWSSKWEVETTVSKLGRFAINSFRHRSLHSQCTAGQSKPSSWKGEPAQKAQKALVSATLMCGMPEVQCLAAHRHVSWSIWGRLSRRKALVSLSADIYTTCLCALLSLCWIGHLQQHSHMAQGSPDFFLVHPWHLPASCARPGKPHYLLCTVLPERALWGFV